MTEAPNRPTVLTEVDGDVWRITLDRPETGNALTPALAAELAAALADRPEQTRAVLLLANGPAVLRRRGRALLRRRRRPRCAFVGQLAHDWHEVIRTLLACPVPVVAGVQGAVAGAGVGLLGACDLVVCARDDEDPPGLRRDRLLPRRRHLVGAGPFPRRPPGAGPDAHQRLAHRRRGPPQRAGRPAGRGRGPARDRRAAVAHEIAAGPIRAMVRTRALVRGAATRTLDEQLDDEAQLIAESAADPEGREGVRAFVEKRVPDFRNAR